MGARELDRAKLDVLLDDAQLYHDEMQLKYFIVSTNGHGTLYGMYRQVLMELDSRRGTLAERERDLEAAKVEHAYARAEGARRFAWTAKRRRERDLARIEARKWADSAVALRRQIADLTREMVVLVDLAGKLKGEIGVLTDDKRAELSTDFWLHKLGRSARLSGTVDSSIMELLLGLPPELYEQATRKLGLPHVQSQLDGLRSERWALESDGTPAKLAPVERRPELVGVASVAPMTY